MKNEKLASIANYLTAFKLSNCQAIASKICLMFW